MTDKVGYGRPPRNSQWKKGQSGNPRGRPKGSANITADLVAELAEVISITESGRVKRITKQRALIKALIASGIKGNVPAANIVTTWRARMIEALEDPSKQQPTAADRKIFDDYVERQLQLRLAQQKGEV